MARSFNQVTLMGNLTRDPELRTTPNGATVCSFSLALNRSYKNSDGNWQALVLELTQTDAFRYRTVQPGAAP